MFCWSKLAGSSRSDSSNFGGSVVVHDLRWAAVLCVDEVAAEDVQDLGKFMEIGVVVGCEDDENDGSRFQRLVIEGEFLAGPGFPTSGIAGPATAASRALLAFTIDCTNPRPLRRLMLGVGSFSFGGWREGVRGCGIVLGMEASGRGRVGVDTGKVGNFTLNAGDSALEIVDFLCAMNAGADDLEEGGVGGFAMG